MIETLIFLRVLRSLLMKETATFIGNMSKRSFAAIMKRATNTFANGWPVSYKNQPFWLQHSYCAGFKEQAKIDLWNVLASCLDLIFLPLRVLSTLLEDSITT